MIGLLPWKMTSALAMSSNRCRRQSTLRFPGINPGEDDLNSSGNCSGHKLRDRCVKYDMK